MRLEKEQARRDALFDAARFFACRVVFGASHIQTENTSVDTLGRSSSPRAAGCVCYLFSPLLLFAQSSLHHRDDDNDQTKHFFCINSASESKAAQNQNDKTKMGIEFAH